MARGAAFVSWTIKGLDDCCGAAQRGRVVSITGHKAARSGLRAEPLNAKQLRSDRGNGISIAANRFGRCTEA